MPVAAPRQLKALVACAWAAAVCAGAYVGPTWHVPDAHASAGAPVAATAPTAAFPH